MTAQSLNAFRRTVTVEWPAARATAARAKLIRVATDGHARIMAEQTARAGGVAPSHIAYANRPGTPVEAVKLPGPIVYRYDYRREIAIYALNALRSASPAQSGKYRDSHTLYLNGVLVSQLPAQLSVTDVIMISNPVPYARRLEIGKTAAGRSFVLQVPDRIYERVAKRTLMPLYRNVAKITFNYIGLPGAWITKGGLGASYLIDETRQKKSALGAAGTKKRRLRRQQPGTPVRAPAIFISSLEAAA